MKVSTREKWLLCTNL